YEAAAMSEPASVALHAFKKAELKRDGTIVIFGVGPIGLIAANWAREAGAAHIIMVARSQAKKEFAERLGFVDTVDSNETDVSDFVRRRTRGNGADAAIEGTGTSECLEQALFCVRNFGRVVTMGNPLGDMQLSQQGYWQILRKELRLCGTWNSSFSSSENDWLEVMDAMKSHAVDLEALISHRFKLRDYEQAFRLMHEKLEPYCKVMFVMDD
ncbi:MAG: zinc-binding dehydrogenase, partial [Veillonellaceae bacterium]|nr:zinc-binding dehydrogenase [Veillonellaceae bacterium]